MIACHRAAKNVTEKEELLNSVEALLVLVCGTKHVRIAVQATWLQEVTCRGLY